MIKYSYLSDEDIYIANNKEIISNCFFCSNELMKISQISIDKIQTQLYDNFNGTDELRLSSSIVRGTYYSYSALTKDGSKVEYLGIISWYLNKRIDSAKSNQSK